MCPRPVPRPGTRSPLPTAHRYVTGRAVACGGVGGAVPNASLPGNRWLPKDQLLPTARVALSMAPAMAPSMAPSMTTSVNNGRTHFQLTHLNRWRHRCYAHPEPLCHRVRYRIHGSRTQPTAPTHPGCSSTRRSNNWDNHGDPLGSSRTHGHLNRRGPAHATRWHHPKRASCHSEGIPLDGRHRWTPSRCPDISANRAIRASGSRGKGRFPAFALRFGHHNPRCNQGRSSSRSRWATERPCTGTQLP